MSTRWAGFALTLIAVIGGLSACGNDDSPGARPADERSPVCRAFDDVDWDEPPVDENATNDQVRSAFDAQHDGTQAIVDAAEGDLETLARDVLAANDRYWARFLEERISSGDGHLLVATANAAGYPTTWQYVESLVFDDPGAVEANRRLLAEELAIECDGLVPLDPAPLEADAAPPGEILAAKAGTNEIHRFRADGTELARLELPGVVGPISALTLSADGTQLAFLAGTDDPRLWAMDLRDGHLTSTTSPGCMDWHDDRSTLWALVGGPAESYVAHISLDGTEDVEDQIHREGCPYRFTESDLVMHTSDPDGAPTRIDRVPQDGSEPTTLLAGSCYYVAPRISPDRERLMIIAGCPKVADSGTIITDLEGDDIRQIARGTTGAGSWSPDGEWVTFTAMSPDHPGDRTQARIIVAAVDGSAMGVVTPPGYTWPTWVSEGVLPSGPG